ncbi:hypothetical protein COT97_00315 [Candidatus Falkowbacteria bacterium CG10_big_fil_rev_8_21_14_0_10_39_11]|uniref:Lipoprotein n=1 Tax=Candidatus Falkowbacteria bacterium CG10_big_fil_rev_8_21_14_0_10_39_11 TaxID=1974565 RepID=A0A2H0V690_9BACT|nr:MAG: hypothetical protein COT97_00315 [Candidatus Falkowbacteria bacterium CG10_big_fil_rev_8_21_14_0_10_39_11]
MRLKFLTIAILSFVFLSCSSVKTQVQDHKYGPETVQAYSDIPFMQSGQSESEKCIWYSAPDFDLKLTFLFQEYIMEYGSTSNCGNIIRLKFYPDVFATCKVLHGRTEVQWPRTRIELINCGAERLAVQPAIPPDYTPRIVINPTWKLISQK